MTMGRNKNRNLNSWQHSRTDRNSRWWERSVVRKDLQQSHLRAVEDVEQAEDKATVPVISDTTSIVTLPSEVAQCFQRCFIILIDEHLARGSVIIALRFQGYPTYSFLRLPPTHRF